MERSLFGFIWKYSKRDQWAIVPLVIASMVFYYASLDLPKAIINEPIQGRGFSTPDATLHFLRLHLTLPDFLGGARWEIFGGFALERTEYLLALTFSFLALIIISGLIKYQINTMKGWMGERMLRRLRYDLFDHILRFPLSHFRRVKAAEMATMIKDEVEPLGGFVGESIITPLYLGGQALTALFFILFQHIYLGLVAFGMVVVQAVIIPRMRRRLLVLSRERQIAARQLAGRIGECVDGVVEIHANDTSNYERAEFSSRLGRLFVIRFEHHQRKFMIKFLNNLLAQITPFLFYLVGGYLAIVGRLDIGALVAVIAAYKDLPGPVKELIDWDQERMDTSIKYTQVIEQFTVENTAPPALQQLTEKPQLPESGEIRAHHLSLQDESGSKVVNGLNFHTGMHEHVAIVGSGASGTGELAQLVARLMMPSAGYVEMGGIDITRAPESVTGRAIAYVGPTAYLFPVSVRDNLLYGLKHRPIADATYEGDARKQRQWHLREARRAGNSLLDVRADWVDYEAAGVQDAQELQQRLLEIVAVVGLEETLFEIGLRSAVGSSDHGSELADSILRARDRMHERLREPGLSELVERFDPERFNRNASIAENLLFGTPVGKVFDVDNLPANPYVRDVLDRTGLSRELLRVGHKLADTMLELFSDLPPGHELFERFSFIAYDDLPRFKDILSRVASTSLERIPEAERNLLLALPFKLVLTQHRLGLVDEALEERILEARRVFAEGLPDEMRGAIEFFDPSRYNAAASLRDNILFGKIATSQAGGAAQIGRLLRQILEELHLRPLVLSIGLDYHVGNAGARLSLADRQRIAIGRALLKRPKVLILDGADAAFDPAAQGRMVDSVLACREGCAVYWVLNRAELAERFDQVLVMAQGQLVERGPYGELLRKGGTLLSMVGPAAAAAVKEMQHES